MNAFSLPDPIAAAVDDAIDRDLAHSQWSEGLREFHHREMMAKRLKEVRFIHIFAFVFGVACLILDEMVGLLTEGLLMRVGLCGLVFGPAICLPRSNRNWLETVRGVAPPVVAALSVSILAEVGPTDHADRYLMAGGFYITAAIMILPLRMKEHILLAAFGFAALMAPALMAGRAFANPYDDLPVYLLLCCVGPLALAYRMARLRDRNFLLVVQARLAQDKLMRNNALLRRLSDEDGLTGILNRRGFTQRFDDAYAQTLATNETLAVFMIDIDHFKRFNDSYGHPAGDKCLIQVADGLSRRIEDEDALIGRFGGEEFIAAWRGGSLEDAEAIAVGLRQAVSEVRVEDHGQRLPAITASVGWTAIAGKRPHLSTLVNRADKALYRAKQAGRNRVMQFTRKMLPGSD
ncbi:GGDEF domain-containing protein [Pseudoblastomonas halimionae]|uniref:diguanylate cyclase n=1 Tax=Alteriqipengyuania halimionae TaxID=1926630 RepID=A0A6I4U640_9SPHN|nr:GGDEF domain-containing protein [Alteriqipengyuania halimionae]MXP09737.1 diguanylate cyclase [Alteriqipengyuania halimionae]